MKDKNKKPQGEQLNGPRTLEDLQLAASLGVSPQYVKSESKTWQNREAIADKTGRPLKRRDTD